MKKDIQVEKKMINGYSITANSIITGSNIDARQIGHSHGYFIVFLTRLLCYQLDWL